MSLWTREELIEGSKGEMRGSFEANGLSIDSREITKGDLFVALKAERDGHEFVKNALEAGASAALVSHIPEGLEKSNLLVVENVEAALARMGQFRRAQVNAKIVAVTGSAGKTSTKEMLLSTLSAYGKTHASVKSFNNHWGVPLTLARMPRDTDFGVFEIGMNHPGEIEPLVKLVRPDVAIITNIAPVHLAGFGSEDGIAHEKASILLGLSDGGLGIVNGDMKFRDLVANSTDRELCFFGESPNADVRLLELQAEAVSSRARISLLGEEVEFELRVPGSHHVMNALATLGVVSHFQLELQPALRALGEWSAPQGRGQEFEIAYEDGAFIVVDESYNANPLSMIAALNSFLLKPATRHIAILGDMLELGEASERYHEELAKSEQVKRLDKVFAVGAEMRHFFDANNHKSTQYFPDQEGVFEIIFNELNSGDAILIKASNSIGLGRLVDALKEIGQSTQK